MLLVTTLVAITNDPLVKSPVMIKKSLIIIYYYFSLFRQIHRNCSSIAMSIGATDNSFNKQIEEIRYQNTVCNGFDWNHFSITHITNMH